MKRTYYGWADKLLYKKTIADMIIEEIKQHDIVYKYKGNKDDRKYKITVTVEEVKK